MPTTPGGIWTPDDSDDWDLTVDLAAMAVSIDSAISQVPANYLVGTDAQRLALTGARLFEGLEFYATDTNRRWFYDGTVWRIVSGASLEATANPSVSNAVSTAITGWTIDNATSVNPTDVATISGSTITIKPGRYAITVLASLNRAGAPHPVNARSFLEVVAAESLLDPRPRANPAIGEDTWALTYTRTYAAQTALRVNIYAQTAASPMGTNFRLMIAKLA